jgi:hypothetical protein
VEVNAGGTLGGTGFVGPVTLSGGTLSPGNSPGTFFPTEVLWDERVILFDLGIDQASSDFINTGRLDGSGPSGTKYAFTFVDQGLVIGTTYNLISFVSSNIALNDFTFTNGGGFNGDFSLNTVNTTTTLRFTVIPEPTTWGLLLLGSLMLAARFRQRT